MENLSCTASNKQIFLDSTLALQDSPLTCSQGLQPPFERFLGDGALLLLPPLSLSRPPCLFLISFVCRQRGFFVAYAAKRE